MTRMRDIIKRYALSNIVSGLLFMVAPLTWTSPFGVAYLVSAGHGEIPCKKVLPGAIIGCLIGKGGFGAFMGGLIGYVLSYMFHLRASWNPKSSLSALSFVSCILPGLSYHLPYSVYDSVTVLFVSVISMAACPVFSPLLRDAGSRRFQFNKEERVSFLFLCAVLISGLMYLYKPLGALAAGLFALVFSFSGVPHALLAALVSASGLMMGNAAPSQAALILFSAASAGAVSKHGSWAQAAMFLIGVPLSAYFGFDRVNAFILLSAAVYPWIPRALIAQSLRYAGFFDESSHSFLTASAFRRHLSPKGKTVCGDCGMVEKLPGGRMLFALADGMGTGKEARNMSENALMHAKSLFHAPLNGAEAMKCINLLSQGKENHTTMDLCLIDLVTGRTEFIKNGAEATWITGRGLLRRIEGEALPIGTLLNAPPVRKQACLAPGDSIIMATDGLINAIGALDEVEKTILENQNRPPCEICAALINKAKSAPEDKRKDDMSIMCIKISGKKARIRALPQKSAVKKAG